MSKNKHSAARIKISPDRGGNGVARNTPANGAQYGWLVMLFCDGSVSRRASPLNKKDLPTE
jgi:prepilin-type processing-associated H-X9-DG protein